MDKRTIAAKALGAYEWYAEYDPFHSTRGGGVTDDQAAEAAAFTTYDKYVGGDFKLGPSGERARCGWFQGSTRGGGFTDPATPNYVCSVQPTPKAGMMSPGAAPGIKATVASMSTGKKVAIGAAVLVGGYLLLKGIK